MIGTTRRALLAGSAALTALSAPVAVLAAAPTFQSHDPGLLRCIAAHRHACNAIEAWHTTVYDPARQAYLDARAAIPHVTTQSSFVSHDGRAIHMRTDCSTSAAIISDARLRNSAFADDDFGRCCKELSVALDERSAKLNQIDAEWRATGLVNRSNGLGEERFEKLVAIMDYPVGTVADFILKLETIREYDDEDYALDRILDDLNRIAGRS